jgi:DNA processing protein
MSQLMQWLTVYYTRGLRARQFKICLEHYQDIAAFFRATNEEWQELGVPLEMIAALRNPDWKSIERDMAWVSSASHHHIISYDDTFYPTLLKNTADPPLILFLSGEKENLVANQIAIVGSRHATVMGKQIAEQFAYQLAQAGLTITSGLATGIDAAGHRGALKAKGRTIAVAGTGLFHIYPPSHKKLNDDIVASQGVIISEFPLPTPPRASHFPRRNRIIAGLSRGVLVVEAALKSGSLITARLAAEEGRDVFAIPGSIHHPLSRGSHHLIRQGAK